MRHLCLISALLLTACAPAVPLAPAASGLAAAQAAGAKAVAPGQVPAEVVKRALGVAQPACDKASERRDIDYFALPSNPAGIQLPGGAWVLSFLGTGKTDGDVNVELRTFVDDGGVAVTMNYSGPTTLGRSAWVASGAGAAPRFELVTGVPGNGVADAWGEYVDGLAGALRQRWGAQPFAFDDGPIVFAYGDQGFVFTDQGNRLVLGDRKYADVQNVAYFSRDAKLRAAYTIVGFNAKTPGPGAAPAYEVENDDRFGLMAVCGEI